MIVTIANQAAKAVVGLFGLRTNQAPRELDNGPAQPTYDLTRLAELASGKGDAEGFVEGFTTMVHAIAGDLFATVAVDDIIASVGEITTDRAWLINAGGDEDTENIATELQAVILYPVGESFPTARLLMAMHASTFSSIPTSLNGVLPAVPTLTFNGPIYMPKGTIIRTASSAAAAGTIRVVLNFWVGPIGSRPPGA